MRDNDKSYFFLGGVALITLILIVYSFFLYNSGVNNGMIEICESMDLVAAKNNLENKVYCYSQERLDLERELFDNTPKLGNAEVSNG